MITTLDHLLHIKCNEVYSFTDDDILLIKLAYNIDFTRVNNINPYLERPPSENFFNIANIFDEVMRQADTDYVVELLYGMAQEYHNALKQTWIKDDPFRLDDSWANNPTVFADLINYLFHIVV